MNLNPFIYSIKWYFELIPPKFAYLYITLVPTERNVQVLGCWLHTKAEGSKIRGERPSVGRCLDSPPVYSRPSLDVGMEITGRGFFVNRYSLQEIRLRRKRQKGANKIYMRIYMYVLRTCIHISISLYQYWMMETREKFS